MAYYNNVNEKTEIGEALEVFLADTMIAYYKTHSFHWNVEGEHFYPLHQLFEKLYQDLWESLDDIAERMRALGSKAPPSYYEFLQRGTLKELEGIPVAKIMLRALYDDYMILVERAIEVAKLAEAYGDLATQDLMTQRVNTLEKFVWILHSSFIDG